MNKIFELQLRPQPATLRLVGIVVSTALMVAAIATDGRTTGIELAFAAFAAGVIAGLRPAWYRILYNVVAVGTFPIGIIVSFVLLATVYFGVFGIVAIGLRVSRRDLLNRGRDPGTGSYWMTPRRSRELRSYFHQF